jgi:hypothetical protein
MMVHEMRTDGITGRRAPVGMFFVNKGVDNPVF